MVVELVVGRYDIHILDLNGKGTINFLLTPAELLIQ